MFFGVVVWNIRIYFPAYWVTLAVLIVIGAGIAAGPITRLVKPWRPEQGLAALFSVCWLGSRLSLDPQVGAWLVIAAAAAWFAWLPAWLTEMARLGELRLAVPGFILGLAADVGLRTFLHGLDLPALASLPALLGTLVLLGLFLRALAAGRRSESGETVVPDRCTGPFWAPALLGVYLFLQLTLLSNPGRVAQLEGWTFLPAAAFVMIGLLAALGALPRVPGAFAVAAPIAALFLLQPQGPRSLAVGLLQVGATVGLAQAFHHAHVSPGSVYRSWAWGAVLFILATGFHYAPPYFSRPEAWAAAALLLALPALRRPREALPALPGRLAIQGTALAAVTGLTLGGYTPRVHHASQGRKVNPHPGTPELRVVTYNIQYGYDVRGRPALPAVADFLHFRRPDLVALQEISRGDLAQGGIDMVAYFRRRFPDYRVLYGPTRDDVGGNLLLTRLPVREWGFQRFPARNGASGRGFVWAQVSTVAGDLLFLGTHLAGYWEPDGTAQAQALTRFRNGRPRMLMAGDFNAPPGTEPYAVLQASGLVDVAIAAGEGSGPTFRANRPIRRLDLLWTSPDLEPVTAQVHNITLSDHLPVEGTVRLPID